MIYGSHNTFSYLKPKFWILNLFKPFTVCQDKNLEEQVESGVTAFDLRIFVTKFGSIHLSHGYYIYDVDLETVISKILKIINSNKKKQFYLRVMLENVNGSEFQKQIFRNICDYLLDKFSDKNIKLFGGCDKYGKERIYRFADNYLYVEFDEFHASVSGKGIMKILPRIFNEKNISKRKEYINNKEQSNSKVWIDFI